MITKEIAIAYARWISDNGYELWNETQWYSYMNDDQSHLTDEELFAKFMKEYEK